MWGKIKGITGKRRKQDELRLDDQQTGSTAIDQHMQEAATSSQDPNGSQHRGKIRSDEQEEEKPGTWRTASASETTSTYKRGGEEAEEGRRKISRIEGMQEDLRLDWIHDVRTKMEGDKGCMDTMRDMEQRGDL